MIACEELTKTYGEECILDGFSGTFLETGFYLLLGESGSGKTSFLNLLAGFLPFESGTVRWDRDVYSEKVSFPGEVPFDYMTQDSFFVDFLTVEENLKLLGDSAEAERKASDLLQRFGLFDKRKAFPSSLSGGERGRLAIIRALLKGKKVLLLDEPTAALDEKNKRMIFEMLSCLKSEVLILCASHDQAAIPYADVLVRFSKTKKTPEMKPAPGQREVLGEEDKKAAEGYPAGALTEDREKTRQERQPDPVPYLKKWFSSSRREQQGRRIFLVFLVVSLLLLLIADTPGHKSEATCAFLYHINTLELRLTQGLRLSDLAFDREEADEIVVDYRASCPNGAEAALLENFIWVLPEQEKLMKEPGLLAYGSYFTGPRQVILSFEMAERMSPGHHEKLIGKTLTRTFWKLGSVELEITGVLKKPDTREKYYLNACGAEYSLEEGGKAPVSNLFFVNAALLKEFTDDPAMYRDEGQRGYILYFDTSSARNRFLGKYQEAFREQGCYLGTDAVHAIEEWEIPYLFWVLMPISVLTGLFTLLFYVEISRTEFVYSNVFVSVFEYAGYQKSTILRAMIRLGILEFLRMLGLSALIAGVLSVAGNLLNHRYLWVKFELFSYDPLLIAAYFAVMTGIILLVLTKRFKTVRVRSWYENLIANRDVL